jgi:CRP-like cAMP-binding protein
MITAATITGPQASPRCLFLQDSVLASSLSVRELARLELMGEVVAVPSGTPIFRRGDFSDHLYVVLDGLLVPETAQAGQVGFWIGPGDICGEVGFVLGTPRNSTVIALGLAPLLWRIRRDVLAHLGSANGVAVTRMLAAVARAVRTRLDPQASKLASMTEADVCDHRHPSVVGTARRLARRTPLQTASAIWSAVWEMPHRFGSWQWSASDTLARGHGMCTSKAVLQVALMRASGIEAGYVKATLDGALVRACMPSAYQARFMRESFKHCHAAARIDGRWIPFDASFSRGALALAAETEPKVRPYVRWDARKEGFAHLSASLAGTNPFAIEVHQDLGDLMRKVPSQDAKNADALNVLLDRAQGFVPPAPAYVTQMNHAFAVGSFLAARSFVVAGLSADATELLRRRRAPEGAA